MIFFLFYKCRAKKNTLFTRRNNRCSRRRRRRWDWPWAAANANDTRRSNSGRRRRGHLFTFPFHGRRGRSHFLPGPTAPPTPPRVLPKRILLRSATGCSARNRVNTLATVRRTSTLWTSVVVVVRLRFSR